VEGASSLLHFGSFGIPLHKIVILMIAPRPAACVHLGKGGDFQVLLALLSADAHESSKRLDGLVGDRLLLPQNLVPHPLNIFITPI
jgi:hypothetical protein